VVLDDQEVIMFTLEVRPAEGGEDAVRFAAELTDSVLAGARRAGVDTSVVSATDRGHVVTLAADPG
jgi:protein subunit release factor A